MKSALAMRELLEAHFYPPCVFLSRHTLLSAEPLHPALWKEQEQKKRRMRECRGLQKLG